MSEQYSTEQTLVQGYIEDGIQIDVKWRTLSHCYAVEPVLKDHPTGHKNVSQGRWSLVTVSFIQWTLS